MIRREGQRLLIAGPVTFGNATQVHAEGLAQVREGIEEVDLGEVTELDSALVALVLDWLREANRLGRRLRVRNLPPGMQTIVRLYGVADLIPAA